MKLCQQCWLRFREEEARFCGACGAPLRRLELFLNPPSQLRLLDVERSHVLRALGHSHLSTVELLEMPGGEVRVLKRLTTAESEDGALVDRFVEEARIHRDLDHPGVPRMHAFGQLKDGALFLLLDYMPGHTMGILRRKGRLPIWQHARRIVQQLAAIMAYVHGKGVIHRDLKPSNILLNRHSQGFDVTLLDFGLARRLDADHAEPASGLTLGTPEYMSPEQALAREVDHRSDIYSLGVILYELLTGHHPFEGTPREVMRHHVVTAPQPPREVLQGRTFPASLETICLRALEKDPDARYPSMASLNCALAAVEEETKERSSLLGWRPFSAST